MNTAVTKRNKRRKHKPSDQIQGKINLSKESRQQHTQIMKLKSETNESVQPEVKTVLNGHTSKETESMPAVPQQTSCERCRLCHKEYQNNSSDEMKENHLHNNIATSSLASEFQVNLNSSSNSSVNTTTSTTPSDFAKTCQCKSCLERRKLEANHLLETQLRHAWTQVRYTVKCAYHDPMLLTDIDSEEFKGYAGMLVTCDAHLLFCRIENTARDYVNEIKHFYWYGVVSVRTQLLKLLEILDKLLSICIFGKYERSVAMVMLHFISSSKYFTTRILKQLTNGFDTPALACAIVNSVFEEYHHLMNSARTVSSLLWQLEVEHMCQFNKATWEQHNMHLFQSMVYSEPIIQRTSTELINQLQQGSKDYDMQQDNIFSTTLLKYLKFDTSMNNIGVAWRDVQKLIDDFNDERVEARRKQRKQKVSSVSQTKQAEQWELFRVHQEAHNQLFASGGKASDDGNLESRLSLTLRQALPHQTDGASEREPQYMNAVTQTNTVPVVEATSFNATLDSDDRNYLSEVNQNEGFKRFLSPDYIRNIKPPSVSSDDSDESSGDDGEETQILEHPNLIVPSDLDVGSEIDSIGSFSPQPGSGAGHCSLINFDGSTILPCNSSAARSFILPAFQHTPYHPRHHLRNLSKSMQAKSDSIFTNSSKFQSSSDISSKTDVPSPLDPNNQFNVLLPPPNLSPPKLEILEDALQTSSSVDGNESQVIQSVTKEEDVNSCRFSLSPEKQDSLCSSEYMSNVPGFECSLPSIESTCQRHDADLSSSSSMSSSSTISFSEQGYKTIIDRKLVKGKLRSSRKGKRSQNISEKYDGETKKDVGVVSKVEERSDISDEDADDEYDDCDDDDVEEFCKCERCIATMNLCRSSSRNYLAFNNLSQQYMTQTMDPTMTSGGASCECNSCLKLAAVSLFAAQSVQPSSDISNFTPTDASSTNLNVPCNLQNQFYSPIQDLRSIIHPHLYGLSAGSANGSIAPSIEQNPVSNNVTLTSSGTLLKSPVSPSQDGSITQEQLLGGASLFHHTGLGPCNDWGMFGKTSSGKVMMNPGNPNGIPNNLSEWQIPGHQAWLNGTGNTANILPSHLVAPGNVSAFQQYITNSSMAAPGYLQPFIPGAIPLTHTGPPPQSSFLLSQSEEEDRLFHSSGNTFNTSSSHCSNTTSIDSQELTFSALNSSSVMNVESSHPNSTSFSSIFTPPSSMNYFSSSIYAPVPDFTPNTLSPFSSQVHTSANDMSHAVGPTQASHSIRFHPGTSVSLKDGQLSVTMPDAGGLLFNSTVPFSSSDKSIASAISPHSTFTPTSSENNCSQLNPFLHHGSSTTGSSPYSSLMPQSSGGNLSCQANTASTAITSASNPLQVRQQILRRKKLVAQSKLTKQSRPQQQSLKPLDQYSTQDHLQPNISQKQEKAQQAPVQIELQNEEIQSTAPSQQPPATTTSVVEQKVPHPAASMITSCSSHSTTSPAVTEEVSNTAKKNENIDLETTEKQQPIVSSIDRKALCETNQGSDSAVASSNLPEVEACQHQHGGAVQDSSNGNNSTSTNSSASNCKYCNCCYCEFFGNGGPPQAPTSKNFHEMRDRLRRKLHSNKLKSHDDGKEDSKGESDNTSSLERSLGLPSEFKDPFPDMFSNQPSVEELLSFIEGNTSDERSKKSGKKTRQKQKKGKSGLELSSDGIPMLNGKEIRCVVVGGGGSKSKVVYPKVEKDTDDDKLQAVEEASSDKSNKKKKKKKSPKVSEQSIEDKSLDASSITDETKLKNVSDLNRVTEATQTEAPKSSDDANKIIKRVSKLQEVKGNEKSARVPSQSIESSKQEINSLVKKEEKPSSIPPGCEKTKATSKGQVDASKMNARKKLEKQEEESSDDDWTLQLLAPQALKKSELQRRRHQPRDYLKKEISQIKPNHKSKEGGIQEPIAAQTDDTRRKPSNTRVNNATKKAYTTSHEEEVKTTSREGSVESLSNNTSGSTTPEKVVDGDGVEAKKNKNKKQRKKNRGPQALGDGSGGVVDQVFLPREVPEEDAKEMDDAEKEIERFKKFCLDSSVLNKPKKITVNWKDFSFRKNHSTH